MFRRTDEKMIVFSKSSRVESICRARARGSIFYEGGR